MQKEKRKIQITDAKVRGFWADSKKLARFLSKLLRQGNEIATEYGEEVELCRKGHKKKPAAASSNINFNLKL